MKFEKKPLYEAITIKTKTYFCEKYREYLIDEVTHLGLSWESPELIEYYIYNTSYGIKMLMWGTKEKCLPNEEQILQNIEIYKEMYED